MGFSLGGALSSVGNVLKQTTLPGFILGGGSQGPNDAAYMGGNTDIGRFGANPYSSSLQTMIGNMQGPTHITGASVQAPTDPGYTGGSYQAKDMSNAALPQYDAVRSRLNQQYSQQQSQAQDALDRQFAAAGGGPGNGAQAKQTENLATSIEQQKGQDLQGLNAQEAAARTALQQQEANKEFQSGEAARGYGFQAQEAGLGRQFTANQFNAESNQQAQQFNSVMDQNFNAFKVDAGSKLAALNTSWDEAQQEAVNNEFNKSISDFQARHSGGLLGGGGFLGTGIGA